jgi:hypothetical protein
MENEERSIASLPQQAQELLLDHNVWMNKSVDHWFSSNENMPVTWHGPEPGIGLRASPNYRRFYSFDNALVAQEVFPEGELDADPVIYEKQTAGD